MGFAFDVGCWTFSVRRFSAHSGRVAESGLRHSTRNRAWGNPPWVRIPPLPSCFEPISESNSPLHRIQLGNEIGVASETFNSTLLTSLLSFYECTLSLSLSLNHHH